MYVCVYFGVTAILPDKQIHVSLIGVLSLWVMLSGNAALSGVPSHRFDGFHGGPSQTSSKFHPLGFIHSPSFIHLVKIRHPSFFHLFIPLLSLEIFSSVLVLELVFVSLFALVLLGCHRNSSFPVPVVWHSCNTS